MRYLKLSQVFTERLPRPYHIDTVDKAISQIDEVVRPIYVTQSDTPINATWGTGVYQVEADGSLKLIDEDFDSSD